VLYGRCFSTEVWNSARLLAFSIASKPGLRSGGMTAGDSIFVGKGGGEPQALLLKYANRHGLIAGATGTGKTVSLQVLA
jgi:Cdc6-like AAA superfamily ATPase